MEFKTNIPLGFAPKPISGRATNRTGGSLATGSVCQLDLAQSDGDVSNNLFSDENSGWGNVIAPAAATPGRFIVVYTGETALADNATGTFMIQGVCQALVQKNSGNIAAGDPLVASTNKYFDADTSAGNMVFAIATEAETGPSTAALCEVVLDGVNGFGTLHS